MTIRYLQPCGDYRAGTVREIADVDAPRVRRALIETGYAVEVKPVLTKKRKHEE